VKVGNLPPAQGRGLTKRDAESAAATLMLEQLSKT
jgi:ribonuclease-3